jgi:hypothetical protein
LPLVLRSFARNGIGAAPKSRRPGLFAAVPARHSVRTPPLVRCPPTLLSSDQMRGVWLLLLLTGCCWAQQGEYVLAGSVVNSRTGEPVKRALVTAMRIVTQRDARDGSAARPPGVYTFGSSANSAAVFTDVSGAFRFTGLASGTYNLSAQKPHFTEPPTERVPIRLESSSKEDVHIELSPLGTIEGKITDQRGQPVSGASVIALQTHIEGGGHQISPVDVPRTTDDRGVFRFWNLEPGHYLVKAAGHGDATFFYRDETIPFTNGGFLSFAPTYLGGPTADSATAVVIEPGTEARADIAVMLQPAHKVRGRLENLGAEYVVFALLSGDEDVGTGRVNYSRVTGVFEMLEVVNGSYTLRATEANAAIAELPIVVRDADVSGLRMTLAGPVEIPVRIHVLGQAEVNENRGSLEDGSANPGGPPPAIAGGHLSQPQSLGFCTAALDGAEANSRLPSGLGGADGPATVLPGRYRVSVTCVNAYVISVAMGSTDLLTNPWITVALGAAPAPIEIVARHGGGNIMGEIKVEQDAPGKTRCALAVPGVSTLEPTFWCESMHSGEHKFFLESLAPGDYTLYAFSTDQIEYRNPEFLRGLSGGESVHVDDGATATVTITRLAR